MMFHLLLSRMPNHELTAEQSASMDKRNARLKRLISFVDENFMDKIRLSDFAESEGCSMSYLSHFIKDTMNQTFQEYVTSVRVGCACKLIAAGGKRMLDVCMESGFSDYRYFSKAFRKQ
jgi:AraC-like DNA-binding protein